jgi:hypothetical protein
MVIRRTDVTRERERVVEERAVRDRDGRAGRRLRGTREGRHRAREHAPRHPERWWARGREMRDEEVSAEDKSRRCGPPPARGSTRAPFPATTSSPIPYGQGVERENNKTAVPIRPKQPSQAAYIRDKGPHPTSCCPSRALSASHGRRFPTASSTTSGFHLDSRYTSLNISDIRYLLDSRVPITTMAGRTLAKTVPASSRRLTNDTRSTRETPVTEQFKLAWMSRSHV